MRIDQRGSAQPLLLPLVVSLALVIGLAGFGIWSYLQYVDAKDNADQQAAAAVSDAETALREELRAEFDQELKSPFDRYLSSSSIGSIEVTYPRSWSAYAEEGESSLDAFFHPGYVPSERSGTLFALRLTVDEKDYDSELGRFDSSLQDGSVTADPITIAEETGVLLTGAIESNFNGSLAMFKVRDKTLKIWTESTIYLDDFNNIILENLTFQK